MMHLQQPKNSRTCGHHCVAMLCGGTEQDLARVIELVGHERCTSLDELRDVALCMGRLIERRYTRTEPLDDCDLLIRVKSRPGVKPRVDHWMCRVNGAYHDPSWHEPWDRLFYHNDFKWTFWKVT